MCKLLYFKTYINYYNFKNIQIKMQDYDYYMGNGDYNL